MANEKRKDGAAFVFIRPGDIADEMAAMISRRIDRYPIEWFSRDYPK